MNMYRNKSGITLIALVITVVILLILAGTAVTIGLNGENLFSRAEEAANKWAVEQEKEIIQSAIMHNMVNQFGVITEDSLKDGIDSLTNKKVEVYTTEGKIRIVFTDRNTYYDLDQNGNINYLGKAKKGLDIGDYVSYTPPEASYLWDGKYSGEGKDEDEDEIIDKTEIKNTDSQYAITSWRVLNIRGSKVDLVANSQTAGTVTLANPQGYNNGVKLLNDACIALYSDEEKGIMARSINIEDIEDKLKTEALESIATTTSNYNGELVANYNNQANNPLRNIYSKYPQIYAEEYRSVINGNTNQSGLKRSEQTSFIEPNIGTETDWSKTGRITTVTSIQPYLTYYKRTNTDLKNDFKNQIYYDMLIRSNNYYTNYWIASRSIGVDWCATYHIFSIKRGEINPVQVYVSYDAGRTEHLGLLPIVTVDTDLLTEGENTDSWIL